MTVRTLPPDPLGAGETRENRKRPEIQLGLDAPDEFIGFGAMDATKPYEFIGFGAMDATKPYELIGFGAMDATKPMNL